MTGHVRPYNEGFCVALTWTRPTHTPLHMGDGSATPRAGQDTAPLASPNLPPFWWRGLRRGWLA